MKSTHKRLYLFTIIVLAIILSCGPSSGTATPISASATPGAGQIEDPTATATSTQIPPPENTATSTTAPPTATIVPTSEPPTFTVSVNTNCRTGPGAVANFPIVGSILIGEVGDVVGIGPDDEHAIMNNLDAAGTCWAWLFYATRAGDWSGLPVIPIPPLPPASIGGIFWHDLCAVPFGPPPPNPPEGCIDFGGFSYGANGILESGEPGIQGVTLHLGSGACPSTGLETAITDANGLYSFSPQPAGTYCVSITPLADGNDLVLIPGGFSFPSAGGVSQTVTVTTLAGVDVTDVNFGWDFQFLP
ncbi:MAG: hypothetical protein FVQ83_14110 [Chloroflexi bacterium]|nr:hypothetical protein [Chloroflexota bacterium]